MKGCAGVLLVVLLAVTGCSGGAASPSAVNVPQTVVVQETVLVPATVIVRQTVLARETVIVTATAGATAEPQAADRMGDTARGYGYALTALAVEDPTKPMSFYKANPDTRLVAVEIVLENETGEQESSNVLHGVLIDIEGFTYAADSGLIEDQMALIELRPGNKIRGWVGFELPLNAQPARLRWSVNGGFGDQFLEVGVLP